MKLVVQMRFRHDGAASRSNHAGRLEATPDDADACSNVFATAIVWRAESLSVMSLTLGHNSLSRAVPILLHCAVQRMPDRPTSADADRRPRPGGAAVTFLRWEATRSAEPWFQVAGIHAAAPTGRSHAGGRLDFVVRSGEDTIPAAEGPARGTLPQPVPVVAVAVVRIVITGAMAISSSLNAGSACQSSLKCQSMWTFMHSVGNSVEMRSELKHVF